MGKSGRDNFTQKTKLELAGRAGNHCSNPSCRRITSGPSSTTNGTISLGVAAHITAASPGGARYNHNLSSEQRRGLDNGIWLCVECSALIDKVDSDYSVEQIQEWKRRSEISARSGIEFPGSFAAGNANAAIVPIAFLFKSQSILSKSPRISNVVQKITIKPMHDAKKVKELPPNISVSVVGDPRIGLDYNIVELTIQNAGTGAADWASIHLNCHTASIQNISSQDTGRVEINYTGGGGKSQFAEMLVSNLRPQEIVHASLKIDIGTSFNVTAQDSQDQSPYPAYVFEVGYGEVKPSSAKRPAPDKDNFPFMI